MENSTEGCNAELRQGEACKNEVWQDELYRKVFSGELRGLERRAEKEKALSAADIDRTLQDMYTLDGADWLGRGEVGDITSAATIAAYESFKAALEKKER
jgi:hypothetical protein